MPKSYTGLDVALGGRISSATDKKLQQWLSENTKKRAGGQKLSKSRCMEALLRAALKNPPKLPEAIADDIIPYTQHPKVKLKKRG